MIYNNVVLYTIRIIITILYIYIYHVEPPHHRWLTPPCNVGENLPQLPAIVIAFKPSKYVEYLAQSL